MICHNEVPSDGELDSHINVRFRPARAQLEFPTERIEKISYSFQKKSKNV